MNQYRVRGCNRDTGFPTEITVIADTLDEAREKASQLGVVSEAVEPRGPFTPPSAPPPANGYPPATTPPRNPSSTRPPRATEPSDAVTCDRFIAVFAALTGVAAIGTALAALASTANQPPITPGELGAQLAYALILGAASAAQFGLAAIIRLLSRIAAR